jgi:hypothetical protein
LTLPNFHIKRAWRAIRPFKANPPLVINPNAVLTFPVPLEGFQPVSRGVKGHETVRRMEAFKPQHGLSFKALKRPNPFALKKRAGLLVSEI